MKTFAEALEDLGANSKEEVHRKMADFSGRYQGLIEEVLTSERLRQDIVLGIQLAIRQRAAMAMAAMTEAETDNAFNLCMFDIAMTSFFRGLTVGIEMEKQ